MDVHVYTVEAKKREETPYPASEYWTYNYDEAKGYAQQQNLIVIDNTYEWADSEPLDDFTKPDAPAPFPSRIPAVQERDGGEFWLVWPDSADRGPYPSQAAAVADAERVRLCDECWEAGTGLRAECQDVCSLPLDHAGVCAPHPDGGKTTCDRCGRADRLTEADLSDVLEWTFTETPA